MTTSTSSAAGTGLPLSPSTFDTTMPRRGFLSRLAALPMVGGSVALLGRPTAVAEPVTFDMLQAYKTWLHFEHRTLSWELAEHPRMVEWYGGGETYDRYRLIEPLFTFVDVGAAHRYHRSRGVPSASSRAALVMSTVGCGWREPEDHHEARRA